MALTCDTTKNFVPKTRRQALGTLAALAASAAVAPAIVRAQSGAPLRVGVVATDAYAQAYYAVEKGFFTAAGLNVTLTPMANGGAMGAALAGGSLDIGIGSPVQIATAHENGLPFMFFAPGGLFSSTDPTSLLMVAQNSPINHAAQLAGKVVGDNNLKSMTAVAMYAWLTREKVDPASVKYLELPFSSMAASLTASRIDAAFIAEPTLMASRTVLRPLASPYEAIAKRFFISAWFATKDWLSANNAAAKKFTEVMIRTSVWANRNQKESAAILATMLKISPDITSKMNRVRYAETFEASLLQPVLDFGAKAQVIPSALSTKDLMYIV